VIYSLRGPLKESYQADLDSTNPLLVAAPCLLMAVIAHPSTRHFILFRILWAFCVYLEAVSVLPQLRMMQKAKVVEKFTAHYVFALGLSRFISCAHWILQVGAPGSSTARSGGSIPGSLRRQSLRCSGDR
jgi:ER lumen protein retaining receptor